MPLGGFNYWDGASTAYGVYDSFSGGGATPELAARQQSNAEMGIQELQGYNDMAGQLNSFGVFGGGGGGMFGGGGGGGGMFGWFGGGGGGGGAGAASGASQAIPIVGGVLSGAMAGIENENTDPNMTNQKDGFGGKYKDRRASVGGAVLGGVMGWFGGPAGAALAGPTVKLVHPFMEKGTREMIKFGDSWGGAGGALMMDPIGTVASGKYGAGDLLKGAFLGPFAKWLDI